MNTRRWIAVLLSGMVVAALGHDQAQAQTLVPGDPPFTRDMVDKDIGSWEMLLDIRLSAAQRKQFQDLRVGHWKAGNKEWKDAYLASHRTRVKNAQLDAAERGKIRDEQQRGVLAQVRGAPNDKIFRLVLSIHDAQIVAPGNPPLTRGDCDKAIDICESFLDIRLTMPQRRDGQELTRTVWKELTKAKREEYLKNYREEHALLARFTRAQRAVGWAVHQPVVVEEWRTSTREPEVKWNRWWIAIYDAARKPGSKMNPILAKGEPPLTQDMVNAYADFMEWAYDRERMGGWPMERLEAMRRLITDDWKKDAAGKEAFLADVTWWKETFPKTFPKLSDAERRQLRDRQLSNYLEHVAKTADDGAERRRWIADTVADAELNKKLMRQDMQVQLRKQEEAIRQAQFEGQLEQQRHQGVMNALKNFGGAGYEYRNVFNFRTSRYELQYVPR